MSMRAKQQGFTLIEILIALVVVSVGVLALSKFTVSIMGSGQVSGERLTAVHLAEQVLEQWQHDANDFAPLISSACDLTAAASQPAYPRTSVCTPTTGVAVSYTVVVNQSVATGPLPASLSTMGTFTSHGFLSTPRTRLVTVSWSHKGITRMIYLTHLSQAQ
ncbi:prepilin-type N-terminal cleavage/methylation domain-containing protein [Mariprofundus erugo]|nr:prepilin-type N-terminal cleavage/methylation domain-containing protein [Mariprofundus erugo]